MTFFRFAGLLILTAWATPGLSRADEAAPKRPNLVFLLVDDWRWNALGPAGDMLIQTPNMDAMAAEGVVFENAFVTTSICCVSRASILTGQWERRHGIENFTQGLSDAQWADTYPALLKAAGYYTGFVGKFGVGDAKEMAKGAVRFDFWAGDAGQGGAHFIDPADSEKKHATAKIGDKALEFLKQAGEHKERPFCLSVSFNAVHARDGQPREFEPDTRDEALYRDVVIPMTPLASDEAFEKIPDFVKSSEGRKRWGWRFDTPEKAQSILRDYYRLVSGVDRELGRIRDALSSIGAAENTVIVLTSDNGFALGDRGLADKWFMWDEDIRVPSLVFDPALSPERRGSRGKQMTLNVDFAPTLLDYAGVTAPEKMQGKSLRPLLAGKTPDDWRTEFFYEHHSVPSIIPQVEGVRTQKWKYIRWIKSDPLVEELYDLEADPLEQENHIHHAAAEEVLTSLRSRWRDLSDSLK